MYQTWAIAQAITNTLLSMVKQCVLNQSQGFWLLDEFASTFTLCILMKYEVAKILNQPSIQRNFDLELEFRLRMNSQVVSVLAPFLAFFRFYINVINAKVHNMLSIMLDSCFKNMKAIWDYVGSAVAMDVVVKYDVKSIWILWRQ